MNTSSEKCRDCKYLFTLRKHVYNRQPFKGTEHSGLYACIVEHELDNNHTGHLFTNADGKCEMFIKKDKK